MNDEMDGVAGGVGTGSAGTGSAGIGGPVEPTPEVAMLRARLLQAELRTEAVRAGMVDLDGVKLVDTSALVLDADGALQGGAALMAKLRADKPWLFGRSSSSGAVAPRAVPARPRTAMEMTTEEWRAARAELLRRM